MDIGSRVLLGAGWVVVALTVAPDMYVMLRDGGQLSAIGGLSDGRTEALCVIAVALVGPLLLWLTGRS